jgi:protocatechuate 4,5-dioxygenase, alpha chain
VADKAFYQIPGTTVFDGEKSRAGYHLNMFCMSLMNPENRAMFKADEAEYLSRRPLTDAQRAAVLARDWNEMLRLGGNVYYTAKLAASDGWPVARMSARMAGMELSEYNKIMVSGGRAVSHSAKAER